MRSSSAPWRSLQRLTLQMPIIKAPCAASLRPGAETSEVLHQTSSKCIMRSPVAPWRSLQGT
ncbi:hypothetical protein L195_g036374 [Trifolium pratense]|uniref:Uncharacterized protein n=1 Tax=Trifolium pratense TaxID=57577 RepID=A0A2K3LPA7_TRIPR|nr:hypothetical protein L195_g036374 [Trifolium pratense]